MFARPLMIKIKTAKTMFISIYRAHKNAICNSCETAEHINTELYYI